MHYELVAQCNPTERYQVIRKIETSGGRIRDILEDQSRLLLFIEYDDITPQRSHWFEMLNDLVIQIGETFSFPTPTVQLYIAPCFFFSMLYLIGLGLNGDFTLEGLNAAKRCKTYLESYTSFLTVSVQDLERILKKKITTLTREDVEETQQFLKEAQTTDVALLVIGDPLVATTHAEIIIEARKQNIKTRIIHNSSIYSAVAETGLQIYKFGKTVTIPFPQKRFEPTSFYEIIQNNKSAGAHTLVLLDVLEDQKRYMSPKEAMEILYGLGFQEELVCISRLGSADQNIVYGKIEELLSIDMEYWGSPPHCLVIPSILHFKEEEFLQFYRVNT